ncbi:MAG TPA: hypothetical protein VK559_00860, partial [Ferruginibacter sp.]|nr:hypothetical protein [Ferruginibacter sp.]
MLKTVSFQSLSLLFALLLLFSSCAFKSVTRSKNITYQMADSTINTTEEKLNVFAPRKHKQLKDVLIF